MTYDQKRALNSLSSKCEGVLLDAAMSIYNAFSDLIKLTPEAEKNKEMYDTQLKIHCSFATAYNAYETFKKTVKAWEEEEKNDNAS